VTSLSTCTANLYFQDILWPIHIHSLMFNAINATFYPLLLAFIIFMLMKHAYAVILCFLFLCIVISIVKRTTLRTRPDKTDNHSFPSGHAATSWFIVASMFGFSPYQLNALASLWALGISASRIILKRHHVSDVIIGGVLGFAIGMYATTNENFPFFGKN
jgi:membrane-associated phospholipid phosphatase